MNLTVKCHTLLITFAFLYVCLLLLLLLLLFVLRGKISNLVPPSSNYEDYNTLAKDNMIRGDFALLVYKANGKLMTTRN